MFKHIKVSLITSDVSYIDVFIKVFNWIEKLKIPELKKKMRYLAELTASITLAGKPSLDPTCIRQSRLRSTPMFKRC